jgi:phage tail sheath protein FI
MASYLPGVRVIELNDGTRPIRTIPTAVRHGLHGCLPRL